MKPKMIIIVVTFGLLAISMPTDAQTNIGHYVDYSRESVFSINPGFNPDNLTALICASECGFISQPYAAFRPGICLCGGTAYLENTTAQADDTMQIVRSLINVDVQDVEFVLDGATIPLYLGVEANFKAIGNLNDQHLVDFRQRYREVDDWEHLSAGKNTSKHTYLIPGSHEAELSMISHGAYMQNKAVFEFGETATEVYATQNINAAEVNLTCPSEWATDSNCTCTLVSNGYNVLASVNFGEGAAQDVYFNDFPYEDVGRAAGEETTDFIASTGKVLIIGSPLKYNGTLQRVEFQAKVTGSVNILVLDDAHKVLQVSSAIAVAATGYQQYNSINTMTVSTGQRIGFYVSAADLVAARNCTDGQMPDMSSTTTTLPTVSSTLAGVANTSLQHLIRVSSRPANMVELTAVYNTTGTKLVAVNMKNTMSNVSIVQQNASIQIQQGMNDTHFAMPNYAAKGEMFMVTMTPNSGSGVLYNYTFGDGQVGSVNNNTIGHVYNAYGTFNLSVIAANQYDTRRNNTQITVEERLNMTALDVMPALYGQHTFINITLASGSNYTCNWTIESYFSMVTQEGNLTYQLLANQGGAFDVNVTCSNNLGSVAKTGVLTVNQKISGVKISPKAAPINTNFYIEFEYENGTNVSSEVIYDNNTIASFVDRSTKKGKTNTTLTESAIDQKLVSIRLFNPISENIIVCNYSINTPITGQNLVANDYVEIDKETSITVKATTGSSTNVTIFYGDGERDCQTIPPKTEYYPAGLTFNHTYNRTMVATIHVMMDNVISAFNLTDTIHVLSSIGNYSCKPLKQYYEVNEPAVFNFTRISGEPASLANVSIHWADSPNWEMLSYVSSFTYNHTYTTKGSYNVTVRIHNPIPTETTCQVFIGVEIPVGPLTCSVSPPNVAAGGSLTTSVSFTTGNNVNLTYNDGTNTHVNRVPLASTSTVSTFPARTFTAPETLTINVTGCNYVSCQSCQYISHVQNPLPPNVAFALQSKYVKINDPVQFTVTWTGSVPTNATISIAADDGAAATNTSISASGTSATRTMGSSGKINVTVTMRNLVSEKVQSFEVFVFGPLVGPSCNMYYYNPGSSERRPGFGIAGNRYPLNKPIYFECNTTSGWSLWYVFSYQLEGNGSINCCNHSALASNTFNFTFTQLGNYELAILFWTPFYNLTTTKNISIGGAIKGLELSFITTSWRVGATGQLAMKWITLTPDACICVSFGDGTNKQYHFEGNVPNCTRCNATSTVQITPLPSVPNSMRISYAYRNRGDFTLHIFVYTLESNATIIRNIPVNTKPCSPPKVQMSDLRCKTSKTNPIEVLKSANIEIKATVTDIPCEITYDNKKLWHIFQMNDDLTVNQEVSIDNQTVTNLTTFELTSNVLNYGLYKMVFNVTLDKSKTVVTYSNRTSCYYKTVPSPLRLLLTDGGMNSITKGTPQTICLEPEKHSYDPDIPRTEDQGIGNWTWFCYGENETEPTDSAPLVSPLTKAQALANNATTGGCFRTGPGKINTSNGTLCFAGANMFAGRKYFFKIKATKGSREAETKLTIDMTDGDPPKITVSCIRAAVCPIKSDGFFKYKESSVNPTGTLQVQANCTGDACDYRTFLWRIFSYQNETNPNDPWQPLFNDSIAAQILEGLRKQAISISPDIYKYSPNTQRFRACFYAGVGSNKGSSCLQFYVNPKPTVGVCTVNSTVGAGGLVELNYGEKLHVKCSNFTDSDGFKYFMYYLNKTDDDDKKNLDSKDTDEEVAFLIPMTKAPQPLCVVVSDKLDANAHLCFANVTVKVPPATQLTSQVADMLNKFDGDTNKTLAQGNLGQIGPLIVGTASVLALHTKNTKNKTGPISEDEKNMEIGKSKMLATLTNGLAKSTMAVDFTSVEVISSAVAAIADNADTVDRNSLKSLVGVSEKTSNVLNKLYETGESKETILDAVASILKGAFKTSQVLNEQINNPTYADLKNDKGTIDYDTSIESDQIGMSAGSAGKEDESFGKFTSATHQSAAVAKVRSAMYINTMGAIRKVTLKSIVPEGKPFEMKTDNAHVKIAKLGSQQNVSNHKFTMNDGSSIRMANLCPTFEALGKNCSTDPVSILVSSATFNPFSSYKVPNQFGGASVRPTSPTVTINVMDNSNAVVPVKTNKNNAFIVEVPGGPDSSGSDFLPGNMTFREPREQPGTGDIGTPPKMLYHNLIMYMTEIDGMDQSLHFEMDFNNCTTFLLVLRFGYPPDLNFEGYYDAYFLLPKRREDNMHCPEYNSATAPLNPFTLFVDNVEFEKLKKKVLKKTGDWAKSIRRSVYIGLREIVDEEVDRYQKKKKIQYPYPYRQNIYTNYTYRMFSKSCQSFQEGAEGDQQWTSAGCVVLENTTISNAVCRCTHLTTFAGGWVVPPNKIDFTYVFANFNFEKNMTLYLTEIAIFVVYIMIVIWARRADKQDIEKLGVSPLPDNDPHDMYLYEIVVQTGLRNGAGTDSHVFFILSGEYDETDVRQLADQKRKILRRGATNRFLLAVPRPLGNLQYARIWHDNSGKGKWAGWYCSYFGVVDLQTRQRSHFMVNSWLAVEEGDGMIDRLIPVAGTDEMTQFGEMFGRKAKKDLTEGHLWISVMARPPESRFTRVERVTVCLLLLFLTMLATCMFYRKKGSSTGGGGIEFGPFKMSPNEAAIALYTNLITFLPVFIIMELFRRSRLFHGHANSLRTAVESHLSKDKRQLDSRAMLYRQAANERGNATPLDTPREPNVSSDINLINNEQPPPYSSQERLQDQWGRSVDQVSVHMARRPGTQESLHFTNVVDCGEETPEPTPPPKKKRLFPWQMRIFAWILMTVCVLVSATFTTFYGIMFGDEACKEWISAMFMSFFFSVMLTQPIKVILVAAFISLMCKKTDLLDEGEYEDEDDIMLDELGRKYGLKTDEEWLHKDTLASPMKPRKICYEPPNEEELEKAREYRLQEIRMFDVIREIMFYVIFFLLLLMVTYSFRDPNAFLLKAQMERLYIAKGDSDLDFTKIRTEEQFWNWTEYVLIPGIRASKWYNGDPPFYQRGFTGDRAGRMMGYALIRQLRVKPKNCSVSKNFANVIDKCIEPYSMLDSDKAPYGVGWVPFVGNSTHNNSAEEYTHKTSSQLEGQVWVGKISTYRGDGYPHEMRGDAKSLVKRIRWLRDTHWIDRYTRAIFVQFTAYYPFVNIFGVGTLLLELPGSGGFWTSFRFEPANLLSFLASDNKAFEVVCIAAFFICLVIFLVKEIRKFYKMRKAYFTFIWNWAEMFIIVASILSMAAYALMIIETNRLTGIFKKYAGNIYINFQFVAYWHEHLSYFTSFIVFIATVKFIRLLRFNKRMGMLGAVIAYSAKDIKQFLIIFGLVFFAFVQVFFLLFKNSLYRYHTFIHSTEASMQIALGKFEFLELYQIEPIMGPLVFAVFVIFIIFVMLNMFLAILNEAFEQVRADMELQSNEYELVSFVMKRFMVWTGMNATKVGRKIFKEEITDATYVEQNERELAEKINNFPEKVDQLIGYIDKVYLPSELPPEMMKQKEKSQSELKKKQTEIPMTNRPRRTFNPDSGDSVQEVAPLYGDGPDEAQGQLRQGSRLATPQSPRFGSSRSLRGDMPPVDDVTTEL